MRGRIEIPIDTRMESPYIDVISTNGESKMKNHRLKNLAVDAIVMLRYGATFNVYKKKRFGSNLYDDAYIFQHGSDYLDGFGEKTFKFLNRILTPKHTAKNGTIRYTLIDNWRDFISDDMLREIDELHHTSRYEFDDDFLILLGYYNVDEQHPDAVTILFAYNRYTKNFELDPSVDTKDWDGYTYAKSGAHRVCKTDTDIRNIYEKSYRKLDLMILGKKAYIEHKVGFCEVMVKGSY